MLTSPALAAPRVSNLASLDTLRNRHNRMVSILANMPVTPQPVSYDPPAERQWMLRDLAKYLRQIEEAIAPVFELAGDLAQDFGGAKSEDFDIVKGAFEDFRTPFTKQADLMDEED